jgi:2-oxoglutarate dehydrogenase E2 component (dihydrolipoamide succinyltransferase)
MSAQIIVPPLGESVSEATISKWHKKQGEAVVLDEIILELETEKVNLEIAAPASGVLEQIAKNEGDTVNVGEIVGSIKEGASAAPKAPPENRVPVQAAQAQQSFAPSVNKLLTENNLKPENITGTGKRGSLTKGDVLEAINNPASAPSGKPEERIKMSRLRQTIAQRLKDSQNTAAILTTFNEIDMSAVMNLRAKYKESFEKKHGAKLGFMSFFVKAVVESLKEIPAVNAEIDKDEIIYKKYYDIGVAVGGPQGLVVPVVRNCEALNFAGIEAEILNLSKKARDGKLAMSDLSGGTFSISNGGVYGSLLSTPIINPPQSGILGLHKIQERPVAINGKVEIRPMMYVALSYDHRIIDGKEAVTFLVRVKENIENPERLLLNV